MLVFGHDLDIQQLVAFPKLRGGNSAFRHIKFPAAHDLAHALLRDKQQPVQIQFRLTSNVDNLLRAGIVIADIVDRQPLIAEFAKRNVGSLDRVELSCVGKQTDSSRVAALHDIFEIRVRSLLISLICGNVDRLAVTEPVHEEHNVHLLEFFSS